MAKFVQMGESIDWTASKVVEAGEAVVIGKRVGIADRAMANGEHGVLHVVGVFEFDTDAEIAVGDEVYLASGKAAKSGTDKLGYAVAASASGKVLVKINA